ncbi:hypothetical protein NE237_019531 [Protea cynaroides]|uniref:SHSP domain-containing protein n=1 Tax=Protea cynaroides TaxID=273540 RepID=A0A9Q0H6Q3_9MAGN|nr:hypothetical protein NE237_019531 [Protea cynaroides]
MENSRRRRRGMGERANMREDVYEDFQPTADWTEDANNHVLLIDLPGFNKKELKIEVDTNTDRLTVSGQRKLSENIYKRFKQDYSLPIDADVNKISGKFEGGLLFVIIPKKEKEIEEEPEEQHPVAEGIAEEHKQETSKTEEKPKEEEPKQETTTPEEKPEKDGKDTDVKHDNGNGIPEERESVESVESERNEGKGGLSEGRREKEEKGFKFGFAEGAIEMMARNKCMVLAARNKGMVLAAVLGLAVGIYLSHKLGVM